MMSSGLAQRGMLGNMFGGRGRGGVGQAGMLDPSERRFQAAQPFEAIRQRLMSQGVAATPGLMQSYQDQAGMQGASPVGVAKGGQAPVALAGPNPVGDMANRALAARRKSVERLGIRDEPSSGGVAPWGGSGGFTNPHAQRKERRRRTIEAQARAVTPKMARGSFYQQSRSGSSLKDWKWNRTARAGTQSY
jgi:hypothetical protein